MRGNRNTRQGLACSCWPPLHPSSPFQHLRNRRHRCRLCHSRCSHCSRCRCRRRSRCFFHCSPHSPPHSPHCAHFSHHSPCSPHGRHCHLQCFRFCYSSFVVLISNKRNKFESHMRSDKNVQRVRTGPIHSRFHSRFRSHRRRYRCRSVSRLSWYWANRWKGGRRERENISQKNKKI